MARRKPAWMQKREADKAEARELYYKNRVPSTSTTVKQRNTKVVFYRSLIIKDGTDHRVFKASVGQDSLTGIGGEAAVGLLTAAPADTVASNLRKSGITPSKIHWYKGLANPVADNTPWNSRWTKYYDEVNGVSHFSTPVSKATGDFDAGDLKNTFNGFFNPTNGTKKALLGAANGRAYITFEQAPLSFTSA